MKLLIIRPQPGADATAARVKVAGHEAMLMPLFAVEPVAWDVPDAADYDGLLLTSANAVRQAGSQLGALAQLPVLAVGKMTAAAAENAGLGVADVGNSGVEQLLGRVAGGKLLWLAGEDRSAFSAPASVRLDFRIVYRSTALAVSSDFNLMVSQADHVLLHSMRAARHFSSLVISQGLEKRAISIGALSHGIAEAAGEGWQSVHVAPEPSDAALLSRL